MISYIFGYDLEEEIRSWIVIIILVVALIYEHKKSKKENKNERKD